MAKSFIISTVITVLLVLVVTNLESIISLFQGDDAKEKIAVVDDCFGLRQRLLQRLIRAFIRNR